MHAFGSSVCLDLYPRVCAHVQIVQIVQLVVDISSSTSPNCRVCSVIQEGNVASDDVRCPSGQTAASDEPVTICHSLVCHHLTVSPCPHFTVSCHYQTFPCLPVTVFSCRRVTLSSRRCVPPVIVSSCVNTSSCHRVIISPRHRIPMPLHHPVLTSSCPHRVIMSSYPHVLVSLCPHVLVVSSRHRVLTSSCPHVIVSSRHRVLTSSRPRFRRRRRGRGRPSLARPDRLRRRTVAAGRAETSRHVANRVMLTRFFLVHVASGVRDDRGVVS